MKIENFYKAITLILLFLSSLSLNGQVRNIKLEVEPEPKIGILLWEEYLRKNVLYLEEAKNNRIEGVVYVKFIVEKDGSLFDISVFKGIGHGCDEEALRVVKSSSRWNPGLYKRNDGKLIKVRSQVILPITFKL